jgi:hypothetical protein
MGSLLTKGQSKIWDLRFHGWRAADISGEIGKSRQYVSKSLQSADSKIFRAMTEAARTNKIMIKTMDPERGFLVGYSKEFGSNILLTYSPIDGINVWVPHRGQCKECTDEEACRTHLLREAERLGTKLSLKQKKIIPAKLAGIIFKQAWAETAEIFPGDSR